MKLVVVSAGLSVPSSTRLLADRLAAAVGRQAADAVDMEVVELRELAVGSCRRRAMDAVRRTSPTDFPDGSWPPRSGR